MTLVWRCTPAWADLKLSLRHEQVQPFRRGSLTGRLRAGAEPPNTAAARNPILQFHDGLVTLVARDVTVRAILSQWGRTGRATVVTAKKWKGLRLRCNSSTCRSVTRWRFCCANAGGYLLAARHDFQPGASVFDRIVVVASSARPQFISTDAGSTQPSSGDVLRAPTFNPGIAKPKRRAHRRFSASAERGQARRGSVGVRLRQGPAASLRQGSPTPQGNPRRAAGAPLAPARGTARPGEVAPPPPPTTRVSPVLRVSSNKRSVFRVVACEPSHGDGTTEAHRSSPVTDTQRQRDLNASRWNLQHALRPDQACGLLFGCSARKETRRRPSLLRERSVSGAATSRAPSAPYDDGLRTNATRPEPRRIMVPGSGTAATVQLGAGAPAASPTQARPFAAWAARTSPLPSERNPTTLGAVENPEGWFPERSLECHRRECESRALQGHEICVEQQGISDEVQGKRARADTGKA